MRSPLLDILSPRQQQALLFALEGKSNKAIASAMDLSESTVIAHLNAAYGLLGIEGAVRGKRVRALAMLREFG